jgi:hypothetical protein
VRGGLGGRLALWSGNKTLVWPAGMNGEPALGLDQGYVRTRGG